MAPSRSETPQCVDDLGGPPACSDARLGPLAALAAACGVSRTRATFSVHSILGHTHPAGHSPACASCEVHSRVNSSSCCWSRLPPCHSDTRGPGGAAPGASAHRAASWRDGSPSAYRRLSCKCPSWLSHLVLKATTGSTAGGGPAARPFRASGRVLGPPPRAPRQSSRTWASACTAQCSEGKSASPRNSSPRHTSSSSARRARGAGCGGSRGRGSAAFASGRPWRGASGAWARPCAPGGAASPGALSPPSQTQALGAGTGSFGLRRHPGAKSDVHQHAWRTGPSPPSNTNSRTRPSKSRLWKRFAKRTTPRVFASMAARRAGGTSRAFSLAMSSFEGKWMAPSVG
mmetsp:Transcript_109759/g.310523  ORF Transcript_109759/g.310523 Transcript_109759/m.310523 type:complete len:345 (+) Transcript_109759:913-1947(+)